MSINTTTPNAIIEKINDDYEWIQYNEKLRLIHSIKDDMYSIIISISNEYNGWCTKRKTKNNTIKYTNRGFIKI